MTEEILYHLALRGIPGVGSYACKQLISYGGGARAVFKLPPKKLRQIPGIGPRLLETIKSGVSLKKAESILDSCAENDIEILSYTDKRFPIRLKRINDAPTVIYFRGDCDLNKNRVVSIVGTRQATDYGIKFTEEICYDLASRGVLIVSGLAYGIDIQAHKSAIDNGISNIAVLANGLDIVYPSIHKKITRDIIRNGGLISEYPPQTKPIASQFPERNRIIAGMADAVIVVEAAKKGGALITAEIANSYNRDVFALPGDIYSPYSEGCNNLIKSHKANLINTVKDLEYIMNWDVESTPVQRTHHLDRASFDSSEWLVLESLQKEAESVMIDKLSWQTNLGVSNLAAILLNLEFKGVVRSLPGKLYQLNSR